MDITNLVFRRTILQAKRLIANRFRLLALLATIGSKIRLHENRGMIKAEIKDKLFISVRLLKAIASGDYRTMPLKATLILTGAIIYFLNPADVIPDFIPFSGLVDDFTVLVWTYNSLASEMDKFQVWEKNSSASQ